MAWRPSRAARRARRSTSPPVGGRGGGRGAAAAPPSASGSGSRPPTYPHILILTPPPFVFWSTTTDSHLRSGRVERWAGILGLRWCLVLLNDSPEAVGRRAPGSPRSGPARGSGWRAGTTPSGRPRYASLRTSRPGPRPRRRARSGASTTTLPYAACRCAPPNLVSSKTRITSGSLAPLRARRRPSIAECALGPREGLEAAGPADGNLVTVQAPHEQRAARTVASRALPPPNGAISDNLGHHARLMTQSVHTRAWAWSTWSPIFWKISATLGDSLGASPQRRRRSEACCCRASGQAAPRGQSPEGS